MKTRRVALFVWLACASWAGAQMSQAINGGAPSFNQTYGAGPSSPPQMFQTPSQKAGQTNLTGNGTGNTTGNTTGNGTYNPATGTLTPSPANPAGTTAPGLTGNVPSAPAPVNSPYAGGDLTNFPLPETMEQIDNQRTLTGGDQFVYQVVEDHDKPVLLFVDEKGEIAPGIPYMPELHVKVAGDTLYKVANELKKVLEGTEESPDGSKQTPEAVKSGFYKTATVLLAFYKGNGSRGQVFVFGEVPKPGAVDVPSDSVLTLFQAITAAGGFNKDTADREHVLLTHQSLDDASKVTQQEVNFEKFFDGEGPVPNVVVQPGDVIRVPSRSEHPEDDIVVNGEVRGPLVETAPPPNGKPLYLSEVMIKAGWTDWSNHTVQLFRYKDGKKTEQDIDVDDVLIKGDKDKDVQLQAGDHVYVKRNWWSFGG